MSFVFGGLRVLILSRRRVAFDNYRSLLRVRIYRDKAAPWATSNAHKTRLRRSAVPALALRAGTTSSRSRFGDPTRTAALRTVIKIRFIGVYSAFALEGLRLDAEQSQSFNAYTTSNCSITLSEKTHRIFIRRRLRSSKFHEMMTEILKIRL